MVPIADLDAVDPMMRSPSQCPGTARSSISGGRSEIITISRNRCGQGPSGRCGRRVTRPDRNVVAISRRNDPRP